MRRSRFIFLMGLAAAVAACACSHRGAPPPAAAGPPPAPVPATPAAAQSPPGEGGTFSGPKVGVKLQWPAGWAEHRSDDYVLLLTPTSRAKGAGGEAPSISLDVPGLPPHIPGMIPIGSVRSGYLDDLRKSVGPLKTRDEPAPAVPSTVARLVRSTWTDRAGADWQEAALLMIHADRVYILRARSAISEEQAVRAAFDEVVRSLKWTK